MTDDLVKIDTNFNFQAEMGSWEKDADKYSRRLQEYHRLLWSKPLPDGTLFKLQKLNKACLLRYESPDGEMLLSSDRAVATFTRRKNVQHILERIPRDEIAAFQHITETIGGIIIWPSTMVDGKNTINGSRGFNRLISDRLDLTIECIRRYYLGQPSPLQETFKRYDRFFQLFQNFRGYIDFFLFQDFVTPDYKSCELAPPFDDFASPAVPKSVEEYRGYMRQTTELIKGRNKRIAAYASTL